MWRVPCTRRLPAASGSLEIKVILGVHDIRKNENSWQVIPVLKAFPHKDSNDNSKFNIMLLKPQLNWAVKTIALPRSWHWVRLGQVRSVAD
ncbi:hypothetical protein HPG69_002241 [Diceros bicornis minor]|uniref:Peptidase S1 domain-containing protein n=1 Tax=Diceros bicornis minor TaxID=77932 RepID=A0A7J7FCR3_DICBM|nr:hypothetical protein HPG69_002241 [Diceros bicornis minor]